MASNAFGQRFRITTWGESHGKAIGCVIDGCPPLLEISEEEINAELERRAPGRSPHTSPRREPDRVSILSGIYEGKTTGAPILLLIANRDADSSKYDSMASLLRPGHANYTWLKKYGIFDPRGGGRASARETASRVAAAAIAKKWLRQRGVEVVGYLREVAGLSALEGALEVEQARYRLASSAIGCLDSEVEERMVAEIERARNEGDSVGGVVEATAFGVPPGWGDPIYGKLEARLANAMLSLPACKGFEIGEGFASARMRGSQCNDRFISDGGVVRSATNRAGGVLGGISTGEPLIVRAAFKPTSSIAIDQQTVDLEGRSAILSLPPGSRHDPCVAVRAVSVVEAMVALVLMDCALQS